MRARIKLNDDYSSGTSQKTPGIPGGIPQKAADELYFVFGRGALQWSDERLLGYYHTQAERIKAHEGIELHPE